MNIFSIFFYSSKMPNLKLLFKNKIFNKFISKAKNISIGYSEIRIFEKKDIHKKQITRQKTQIRGWKKNWIVFGNDHMDDFLFIDSESPNLPVFVSENNNGVWEKYQIAATLENFNRILIDLKKMSIKRENPCLINLNPIPESELGLFFSKLKMKTKD